MKLELLRLEQYLKREYKQSLEKCGEKSFKRLVENYNNGDLCGNEFVVLYIGEGEASAYADAHNKVKKMRENLRCKKK